MLEDFEEITNNPYIEKKTEAICVARDKILSLSLNYSCEFKLRKYSLVNSTYYSLFLSGIDSYIGDVENLILGISQVKMDPEKAIAYLNYTKIIQYIHAYYSKTTAEFSEQFVNNINKTLFLHSSFSHDAGIYNSDFKNDTDKLDQLLTLYKELNNKEGMDPLIKAVYFYIKFMKLSPFRVGNGRTARSLFLFYLFRSGFSFGGFFSPEKYFAVNRGRKFNSSLSLAIKSDDLEGFIPFAKFVYSAMYESINKLMEYMNNPELIDSDDSFDLLNQRQKQLLKYLNEHKTISLSEYLSYISQDVSQAGRDFDKLRDLGYIEKRGLGRSTYYLLRK